MFGQDVSGGIPPLAAPSQRSPTVLATAGLVDGCWHSNCRYCRCGGSSRRIFLSFFLLYTRDGWCVGWKIIEDFPVGTNKPYVKLSGTTWGSQVTQFLLDVWPLTGLMIRFDYYHYHVNNLIRYDRDRNLKRKMSKKAKNTIYILLLKYIFINRFS